MLILGIESSCDETAASVVCDHTEVLSNVIASQVEEHKLYGGVVPEIASRRHCENILWVVQKALEDAHVTLEELDGIAVTYAPGLIGALLVGVNFAKGLALAAGKPLIPVHHIAGHIAANYIAHPDLKPPYLCLVVSGGHSHIVEVLSYTEFRVVGRTRDDAAGECFDKCARAMGFPYPGGVHIDKAAQLGNADAFQLPRPKVAGNAYDFSFSGLKTSVINLLHNTQQKGGTLSHNDLAASVQKTISEVVTEHTMRAAVDLGYTTIAVAGGVSANSGVRNAMTAMCEKKGFSLHLPPLSLCGDNAAMIACAGSYNFDAGIRADAGLNAYATMSLEENVPRNS
ncbi:MAG: tRNA (adenosine(37)-N6)-threonylcarbamoyltransferase complex transferase subunit TsaD [Ruminococcus sp.]|nr:tRNA (adenosine(37)-N6)-threonylcarbamoyltransferase complex transferase subunit TsaD [Ruminococcus sp.]